MMGKRNETPKTFRHRCQDTMPDNKIFSGYDLILLFEYLYSIIGSKDYSEASLSGNYRDKTMADKLMPKDETQNYPFCRLKLVVETFEHST